ncbi:MAG TPA: hypothetical protein VHG51_21455 [Longimicrobiaceae bacterium]|nr:hypothetical protein [Longimicrobiaceae bacterium]
MQLYRTAGALLVALTAISTAACEDAGITAPSASPSHVDTQCPPGDTCWEPAQPTITYGSRMEKSPSVPWNTSEAYFKVWSWSSVNHASISSGKVDAESYTFLRCLPHERKLYQRASKTVYGVGRAEVYMRFNYNPDIKYGFQVRGTHTFVPAAGHDGGGTFTSESSQCSDGFLNTD